MDNETRRLNSREQPTRQLSLAEQARPCLRCGTPMNLAQIQTQPAAKITLMPPPTQALETSIIVGKSRFGVPRYETAPCVGFVCMQCGYTELVTDLEKFGRDEIEGWG